MATASDDEELQRAIAASLAAQEKEKDETLELVIALSIREDEAHRKLEQENQAQRLQELQEAATLRFLAQENDQKRKEEEEATLRLLAQEQKQQEEERDFDQILTAIQIMDIKDMLIHVSVEHQKHFLETLTPILQSPAVAGEYPNGGAGLPVAALTDAHKYTCTLIRAGIPVLRGIDDVLRPLNARLNPDMPPQAVLAEVIDELKKHYANEDSPKLQAELAVQTQHMTTSIQNVIASGNPVDIAETQAHVPQLLSRTWTLAKGLGPAYTGAIACALHDNIADVGGCVPGLVARLYPIYAKMIHKLLTLSIEPIPMVRMHL